VPADVAPVPVAADDALAPAAVAGGDAELVEWGVRGCGWGCA